MLWFPEFESPLFDKIISLSRQLFKTVFNTFKLWVVLNWSINSITYKNKYPSFEDYYPWFEGTDPLFEGQLSVIRGGNKEPSEMCKVVG
jgi:hypothetical protein